MQRALCVNELFSVEHGKDSIVRVRIKIWQAS